MPAASFPFLTMNNVADPADLDPAKGECVDLINVDVDSRGGVTVRDSLIAGLLAQPVTEIMGSRNYWAVGNTVYCSRAMDDDEDQRFSIVISLDDMITMIRRVDGGLYVGSVVGLTPRRRASPTGGPSPTGSYSAPAATFAGSWCRPPR